MAQMIIFCIVLSHKTLEEEKVVLYSIWVRKFFSHSNHIFRMHFHEAYLKREKEQFYNHENLSTLLLFSVFFTYQMIRFMECILEYFLFQYVCNY